MNDLSSSPQTPKNTQAATGGDEALLQRLDGRRVPIRLKALLTLMLVACSAGVILWSTLISYFRDDKITYVRDLAVDVASNTARSIEFQLKLHRDRMASLSETLPGSDNDLGPALLAALTGSDDLLFLGLYNSDRECLEFAHRGKTLTAAGVDADQYIKARERLDHAPGYVAARGVVLKNTTENAVLKTFSMTVALRSSHGLRFLKAELLADTLIGTLNTAPGFTKYIVNRQGNVFAHSAAGSVLTRRLPVPELLETLSAQFGQPGAGSLEFTSSNGTAVLSSYASLPLDGLAVVVERPMSDAFQAANRLTMRSLKASFLIIVLVAFLSAFVSRSLTHRLIRLSKAADRLTGGDFDVLVAPGANDELGELAATFNLAAQGLKRRELELTQTHRQLMQSEKLACFGRFSAGIVHEVKNPMASILCLAELSLLECDAEAPLAERLQMIVRETMRCSQILDSLLGITRSDEARRPLSLNELVEELSGFIQPQLRQAKVHLTQDLAATSDLISGDKNALTQVVMNLALNGAAAMEDLDTRKLHIATRNQGAETVELVVSDTGHGIAADKLGDIFEPFYTTKEKGQGTGLGLYVTHTIVTEHGGTIDVESQPGQGTSFRLSFACLHASQAPDVVDVNADAEEPKDGLLV